MNITVVGIGYVGLVCGAGFAEMGNRVICVDTDKGKVASLKQGQCPIYEPGLEEMVRHNLDIHSLSFTTDLKSALEVSDICFIAVGTPMGEDGNADLSYVLNVAEQIGCFMQRPLYIVNKSTVPVGTADKVKNIIKTCLLERELDLSFSVISNPEFLKEGTAVLDFIRPDRIIVGVEDQDSLEIMKELYAPFSKHHEKLISMDVRSSEMTKYAANAMLATKISFINEVANICERVGADINQVRIGIGSDSRIGYDFIYPGCGFGGSCFPKDLAALITSALHTGYEPLLLKSVEKVNKLQKLVLVEKVIRRFGKKLSGMTFAIWGLAFKPGTDDMREAPAIDIIKELTSLGALVKAYDPKATRQAKYYLKSLDKVEFCRNKYAAIERADAIILVTEWKEFRSPNFKEMLKLMKLPVIFDGRNQYNPKKIVEEGFECYQIGNISCNNFLD